MVTGCWRGEDISLQSAGDDGISHHGDTGDPVTSLLLYCSNDRLPIVTDLIDRHKAKKPNKHVEYK